jgi:hypothetical protein
MNIFAAYFFRLRMKLKAFVILIAAALLSACNPAVKTPVDQPDLASFEGTFVSDGYGQRSEGYDWVAVSIRTLSDTSAHVAVRSRVDLKRATCTFDSDAFWTGEEKLVIPFEDKKFILSLSADTLKIRGTDEKSFNLLYYFCSGGATLEGNYVRLDGPVEEKQLNSDGFHKELSLQGITFTVSEMNRGFQSRLIIETSGLENSNESFTHTIHGWVSGAEVEDLNSDGWPELVVYVNSSEGAIRTRVLAYSVNNGKSMSQVHLPDIAFIKEANEGFIGYDEFAVVETSLVQRFPVFRRTGTGYEPTGKTRQVQYQLREGEALRQFVPEKITEY